MLRGRSELMAYCKPFAPKANRFVTEIKTLKCAASGARTKQQIEI